MKFKDDRRAPVLGKFIEKVRFGLHPTFGCEHRDVRANSSGTFDLTYIGWGYFDMPITIYWQKSTGIAQEPTTINHTLNF